MKLLVLDKDGTLTRPKSGGVFPRYPEDQELIDGVTDGIQRYVADGWTIAIASNQGGCAVRSCRAVDFPIGAYYVNENDKPLKVVKSTKTHEPIPPLEFVILYTAEPRPNGKDYLYFSAESIIQFQYKTRILAAFYMRQ
jgi:hypothetical protein